MYGAAYQAIAETFPADYEKLLSQVAENSELQEGDARQSGYDLMRRLAAEKAPLLQQAPDADLALYLSALERTVRVMQGSNPEACDAVFKGDVRSTSLDTATLKAMSEVTGALFRAAAAGRDHPSPRSVAITASDRESLIQAMIDAGTPSSVIALARDPAAQAAASASERCALRHALFAGANRLPLPLNGKFGAALAATLVNSR